LEFGGQGWEGKLVSKGAPIVVWWVVRQAREKAPVVVSWASGVVGGQFLCVGPPCWWTGFIGGTGLIGLD